MPTMRTSGNLLTNIGTDLADNNAGLISAADVRTNMEDIVASISIIVASGDTDTKFGFVNDVRAKKTNSSGGTFIAESGIIFPNAPANSTQRQVQPFLGVGNLQHNSLGGLNDGDPHTQYVSISGHRPMLGNLKMGSNWIGASGYSYDGIQFGYHPTGTTISTSGTFKFADNSTIKSGRGVAKAWISFDSNGGSTPIVKAAYNITALDDLGVGKFRLTIASGVVSDHFIAIGASNATSTSGNVEDFDVNTVGVISRSGIDPYKSVTFAVRNDAGNYVDAEINELVIFSNGLGVTGGTF